MNNHYYVKRYYNSEGLVETMDIVYNDHRIRRFGNLTPMAERNQVWFGLNAPRVTIDVINSYKDLMLKR